MLQKKGAVEKSTTQEGSPDVAGLKCLVKWEKSNGKNMLKKELWVVSSRYHNMSIKDIHSSDAQFSVHPFKNFITNYKNLKKKMMKRVQVDSNNQAVSQHKKSYP